LAILAMELTLVT